MLIQGSALCRLMGMIKRFGNNQIATSPYLSIGKPAVTGIVKCMTVKFNKLQITSYGLAKRKHRKTKVCKYHT